MKMRLWIVCTVIGVLSTPAAAAELFAREYVIGTGAPQTIDDTFAVDPAESCDGRAVYILRVASSGVSSARVTLNGADVLRPDDFSRAARVIETQFAPLPTNSLRVVVSGGRPGSTMQVTVERRIDSMVVQHAFVLSSRMGEFTKTFAAGSSAAAHVLVVEHASGVEAPERIAVRLNGEEVANEHDLRRTGIVRRAVTVGPSNELSAELLGDPGEGVSVSIRAVADESVCAVTLGVEITSPVDGLTFRQSSIPVRGTAIGPRDMGIAVGGTAASIDLNHAGTDDDPYEWIALVKVAPGATTLRATATAMAAREPAEDAVTVLAESPDGRAELAVWPSSGIPPLDVTVIPAVKQIADIALVELDLNSDGEYETRSTTLPQPIPLRYETVGIREVRLRITDRSGGVSVASAAVNVESLAAIDAVIQQRWRSFTTLLGQGNVEDALKLMAGPRERAKYRPALQAITSDLPRLAEELRTIRPVDISGDVAHYLLTRLIDGSVHGFHVYFARASDGQWKVVQF